jgi:hypothetical protein
MNHHPVRITLAVVAILVLVTGCAATADQAANGDAGERRAADLRVITAEELVRMPSITALDAVQNLRPNWLRQRAGGSFSQRAQIQVYMDGAHLGAVPTLRNIPGSSISSIRFIEGTAAAARWGLDHGEGVIYVATK